MVLDRVQDLEVRLRKLEQFLAPHLKRAEDEAKAEHEATIAQQQAEAEQSQPDAPPADAPAGGTDGV